MPPQLKTYSLTVLQVGFTIDATCTERSQLHFFFVIAGRSSRQWDDSTCNCRCKPRVCVEGHYQDIETCDCKPVESTCSAIGVRGDELDSSSSTAAQQLNGASKYIGLTCVALLATIILIFIYLIETRRRGHHGSNGMSHHGISTLTHNGTLSGLPPGEYGKYD